MKRPTLTRRQLLRGGAALAIGAPIIEANWEPLRLELVEQTVKIADLGPEFDGFKIGVMSDVHWLNRISPEFIQMATRKLLECNPDLIVMPGDFVHGKAPGLNNDPDFQGAFDLLQAPEGVVGVLGNHDHWTGKSRVSRAIHSSTNINLIDNSGFTIHRGRNALAIGGIGDLWEDKQDLKSAFGKVDGDVPRILLSHNPDTAESMKDSSTRVDLQISGHTHGGQIVIPGLIDLAHRVSKFGSKFNRGLVEGSRHRVFVSKGVGRPSGLRFCALPDVACLTLVRQR